MCWPNCQLGFFLILILINIPFLAMAESANDIPMTGGLMPQNVDDPDIRALADKAVAKISAESNGLFQMVRVKIISAHSQVVAGVLYHLKVMVGQSSCTKKDAESANSGVCSAEGNNMDARKVYNVKIWQKPWENFEQITYEEEGNGDEEAADE